jgi:hypothetical protein
MVGVGLDADGSLGGNIRHTVTTDAEIDLSGSNGNVIAFGVSSTIIPNNWGNITQNANGLFTNSVAFSTNTLIWEEDKDTGGDTFRTPGITDSRNVINGASDSFLNYRIWV